MNEGGKSDSPVVPAKPLNKAAHAAAEVVEERGVRRDKPARRRE
jgi:RNA-directed DNA polymerase